ncbi:CocE/NonD family hydrolase [Lusitaniella coriacea]|nr:CocE/NonD family hydrolase [Lusitaniella coriacea]
MSVIKETASMLTRDRVRLDSDIYRPREEGTFPVLLMRQPYGRAIASTVVYAHPTWYAKQGYIVVIQDVRGRGTSEGEFNPFMGEVEDGFDTVTWAAQLPRSTGKVGMYGFSYQGMTQLYAAASRPPVLKVLCPGMVGYNLYSDWAYENGAFCLQANLGWAVQLAAETARLKRDRAAYQILHQASRHLPFDTPTPAFQKAFQTHCPGSFYQRWLAHPTFDRDWQSQILPLDAINLPQLHIGGWFDPYLRGTLNLYQQMAKTNSPQSLIIGPWAHLPWGRKVGEIDYGAAAASPVDSLQIRWFDCFLKGKENGILKEPPVRYFEMGSNQWRSFETIAQDNYRTYYLASDGLASIQDKSGQLLLTPDPQTQEDILVSDPWRPVPSLGGHPSIPAGSFERSGIDCRTDVLTYTSEPLIEAITVVGQGFILIDCTADVPSFDLCGILSEVHPDGRVYNFTQGYIRVDFPQRPVKIPLQATCTTLKKGTCLRLSLSATCFPAYAINPGMGAFPGETDLIDRQIITITVERDRASQIQLPLL